MRPRRPKLRLVHAATVAGATLVATSITAFVGTLLASVQPIAGIVGAVILIVLGIHAAWRGMRVETSVTAFSASASVIFTLAGITSLAIAASSPEQPHGWMGISAIVGLSVLIPTLWYRWRNELRELRRSLYADESLKLLSGEFANGLGESDEADERDLKAGLIGLGVGCVPWTLCIPVAAIWASINELQVVDVLLFRSSDPVSSTTEVLTAILQPVDIGRVLAFGALYALIGTVGVLVLIIFDRRPGGMPEFLIDANGLLTGYVITVLVKWMLAGVADGILVVSLGFAFVYIAVLHYLVRATQELLPRWGYEGKYQNLFSGLEALGAGWLLSTALGDAAVIFSGVTFVMSVFMATAFFELMLRRPLLLFVAAHGERPSNSRTWVQSLRNTLNAERGLFIGGAVLGMIQPVILGVVVFPLLRAGVRTLL